MASATKTVTTPVILTLYQQGGKSSSVFLRIAGFSGLIENFVISDWGKQKNISISGAAAVILGAYGAHKTQWPELNEGKKDPRNVFEVANKYHFYNRWDWLWENDRNFKW